MSHSVLTPNVYYTYCTPSRCTGCTELIPHLARPYSLSLSLSLIRVFVFSSLTVANLGSHSTIGPGSKRLLGCASHSNLFFQQVPNILIFPPIATILAPPRYPSQNTGRKRRKKIKLKWNARSACSVCICTDDTILGPSIIFLFRIIPSLLFGRYSSPLYGVLRTSIFPLYKKKTAP